MKFTSISSIFFDMCNFDKELLRNDNGKRPYLLILKLKYKGRKQTFALPFRSNISGTTPKDQFFSLPSRSSTMDGRNHGLHYIKIFPIEKEYQEFFRFNNDQYNKTLISVIEKNIKQIIDGAQNYLDNYAAGHRPFFCTDIDSILETISQATAINEAASTVEAEKNNQN